MGRNAKGAICRAAGTRSQYDSAFALARSQASRTNASSRGNVQCERFAGHSAPLGVEPMAVRLSVGLVTTNERLLPRPTPRRLPGVILVERRKDLRPARCGCARVHPLQNSNAYAEIAPKLAFELYLYYGAREIAR